MTVPASGTALVEQVWVATREPLPLPGAGDTAARFSALTALGRLDLCLAKLVEPHHDAAAILSELGAAEPQPDSLWAVWAAEPPFARLRATLTSDGWRLTGRKAFCSGAPIVTHTLVTAEAEDGARLFAVAVRQQIEDGAIRVEEPDWVGAGMRRADTRGLEWQQARAVPVGDVGAYVRRPGFWAGAVGVAACWLGGAQAVGAALLATARQRDIGDHALAHLGAVTSALDAAAAHLDRTADAIDEDPGDTRAQARRRAESVRASVTSAAEAVMRHVAHALGPAPLAYDAEHATRVDDLAVFLRQHHAERDLAELGRLARDAAAT